MSQRAGIMKSLLAIVADTSALAPLLPGGLHAGRRAAMDAERPFGTLRCREVDHEANTSGVQLVTYEVTLSVYVDEVEENAAAILETYHNFFDRIAYLPALDSDVAQMVLIFPSGSDQMGEDGEDEGSDLIRADTGWTIKLQESKPIIE